MLKWDWGQWSEVQWASSLAHKHTSKNSFLAKVVTWLCFQVSTVLGSIVFDIEKK